MKTATAHVVAGAILILVIVLSAAGQNDVGAKPKSPTRSVQNQGVELSCSLLSEAKGPIELKLGVTNRRKKEIRFFISRFQDYRFIVVDAENKQVPLTRFGEAFKRSEDGRRVPITVPAGESRETTVNLALIFDLSMPGEYRLSLTLRYREGFEAEIPLQIKDIPFTVPQSPLFKRLELQPPVQLPRRN